MSYKVVNKNSSLKNRFKLLLKSAKKRNIAVNISLEHYSNLIQIGCSYCGHSLLEENGYSIDRHYNNKGYTILNCSPCCKVCNRAKGSMSNEDFIEWVERAYKFQEEKKREVSSIFKNENDFKKAINKLKNSSEYRNSHMIEIDGERK